MSDIRDRIARVLHRQATDDGEVHVLWGGVEEHEDEVAEWLPFADALLARWPVLAGVTDEMVETGARALADWDGADWDRPEPEFDAHEAVTKRAYRAGATAVLSAVLGSRDADAPVDGSAT